MDLRTTHPGRPAHVDASLAWEVLAEIAFGVTARVDLARVLPPHAKAGQLVAVKRLHPHLASEPTVVNEFLDEVWLTASLKHPNVVEVAGWGSDEAGAYMVVELVQGVSLARLMKTIFETGEIFTERMVVFIARSICRGLSAAHSLCSKTGEPLGLVHRDLSPGNVLVGFAGQIKVADFGVAKAKQRLTKTMPGVAKGEVAYMAPEHALGEEVDARADIFSLGVVLFELLSGKRPWKVKTVLDMVDKTSREPPLDLRELRPKAHVELCDIVARCLQRDPSARYASAGEIEKKLSEWLLLHGYFEENEEALGRFVRRNAMRQMRWFERAIAGELAPLLTAAESAEDELSAGDRDTPIITILPATLEIDGRPLGEAREAAAKTNVVDARVEQRPGADASPSHLTGAPSATAPRRASARSSDGASDAEEPEDLPTVVHDPALPYGLSAVAASEPVTTLERPDPPPRASSREFDVETEPLKLGELAPPTFRAAIAKRRLRRDHGGSLASKASEDAAVNEVAPARLNLTEESLVNEAERLAILATHRSEDAQAAARMADRKAQIALMAADASRIANTAVELIATRGLSAAVERLQGAWRIEADVQNGRLPRRIPSLARPAVLRAHQPSVFSTGGRLPSARVPTTPPGMTPQRRPPAPIESETAGGASHDLARGARWGSRLFVSLCALAVGLLLVVAARYARLI
jgi:serine/threonine protein kinase